MINFIVKKPFDSHIDEFFEFIISRMELPLSILAPLKSLIIVALSNNANELFSAYKYLKLPHPVYLLVSKGILHPKFLTKA